MRDSYDSALFQELDGFDYKLPWNGWVFIMDLVHIVTSSRELQNIVNRNPGSSNYRFPTTYVWIRDDHILFRQGYPSMRLWPYLIKLVQDMFKICDPGLSQILDAPCRAGYSSTAEGRTSSSAAVSRLGLDPNPVGLDSRASVAGVSL